VARSWAGCSAQGWADADEIAVIEPDAERRTELTDAFPGSVFLNAPEEGMLSGSGDRMTGAVLAVKPEAAEGACRVLGAVGVTRVLSIVAGIPSFRLEAALGGEPSVVRAMPNTPALVGAGVTVISGGSHAPPPTWPGPRT
jgi:pyrroline-5-carboxylate reductase